MFTGKRGRLTTHWVFFLTLPVVGCAPKDAPPPTQIPSQTRREQAPHAPEDLLDAARALLREAPSPASADATIDHVKTQIEQLDLDGLPGLETLVTRWDATGWGCEYRFFSSSDTTRQPLGTFPGGGRWRDPEHERVELADGLVLLRVRHWEGSGTGVVCFADSWLRITRDGVRVVLWHPGDGYVHGWGMPFEKRFKATVIHPADPRSARSIEVSFSLEYESIFPDEYPGLTHLFSKRSRARFNWDAQQSLLRVDPASSDLSEEDVQDIFRGGQDAFLRMNLAELEMLCEKGGAAARAWCRTLLDGCEAGPAKKRLRKALERWTGATERWNPADPLRFDGKPIHPEVFDALQTELSDLFPVETSIDLEGALRANRHIAPVTEKDGWVSCDQEGGPNPAWFKYRYLGSTAGETHVVLTSFCGGGTGVFRSLLFVRILKEPFFQKGEWVDRMLLKLVGEDHGVAEELNPSRILIEKDKVIIRDKEGTPRVAFSAP